MSLTNIIDQGVFNIEKYDFKSLDYLYDELVVTLDESATKKELIFRLKNVTSFNSKIFSNTKCRFFRVDQDGSSYGFDIAIRLKRPELKDYMVLYFFEKEHTVPVFRALAKDVLVTGNLDI